MLPVSILYSHVFVTYFILDEVQYVCALLPKYLYHKSWQ